MPKRKRPNISAGQKKKHNSAFTYLGDYSDVSDIDDLYIYEDDNRVSNTLVKKLSIRTIREYDGFNEELLEAGWSNQNDLFNELINSSPIENGSLLIGFKGLHAMMVFAFGNISFLADKEAFWHLSDYETILVNRLCICHLCFVDKESEDYKVQWRSFLNLELGFFNKLFYVCDFEDIPFMELQAIALSCTPYFYSTFFSDCLEYCKMYAKNFIRTADMVVNGLVLDRLNALAITGTRIEVTSRQNILLGVSANRSVASSDSSSRSSNMHSDIRTIVLVTTALVLFKCIEALFHNIIK